MVRYKTEADDREQRVLAEISLNTPVNRKKRKSTATVSVILSVIYAAFSAWLFLKPTAFYFSALRWFFC